MRVSCPTSSILPALSRVSRAVSPSSPVPALRHVRVDASSAGVRVIGGNGELYHLSFCRDLMVEDTGSALLPPEFLAALRLCGDDVYFETMAGRARLVSGSAEWEIPLSREVYPMPQALQATTRLSSECFTSVLDRVRTARGKSVSVESGGFVFDGETVSAVSGVRAVRARIGGGIVGSLSDPSVGYLLSALRGEFMFGSNDTSMMFGWGSDAIFVRQSASRVSAVLSSLFGAVSPEAVVTSLAIPVAPLLTALKRVSVPEREGVVTLSWRAPSLRVEVDTGQSRAQDALDARPIVGSLRTMSVAASTLLEVVSGLPGPEIVVSLTEDRAPLVSPLHVSSGVYEAIVPQVRRSVMRRPR